MRKGKFASVYPVSAKDVLYILPGGVLDDQQLMVVIRDLKGQIRFKKLISVTSRPPILELGEIGLSNDMHYLHLSTEDKIEVIKFIKE